MNATNLKASLTTLVNSAVASGDLASAPLNVPQTVNDLVGVLSGAEMAAVQAAKDRVQNNLVAAAVRQGVPVNPNLDTRV
jgi:hypothetical protein